MRRISIYAAVLVGIASIAFGYQLHAGNNATDHRSHSNHQAVDTSDNVLPKEAGQSAFAAIAEIVSLLSNDPDTDWSKVDITRLRKHLVDMEMLTTLANVKQTETTDEIAFAVTGTGRTLAAIQSMLPAHSNELNKLTDWNVQATLTDNGTTMTLSPERDADREKILALGFFGVMATGAHHQAHHFAMAKGEMHGH